MENKKTEIRMLVEVVKIERLTSNKDTKYMKMTCKHYINSNGGYVFVNVLSFNEEVYNELLNKVDIGDSFTAKGEFKISIYKDEKTQQYKNGYSIIL